MGKSKHLYDLSRRMDDGKWLCVGKAYLNEDNGKTVMFIDPVKMKQAIKGQKESFPLMMFPKTEPEKPTPPVHKPIHAGARPFVGGDPTQAPPYYTQPPISKPSDDWPEDFDEDIPF